MECETPRLIVSSYKGKNGKTLASIALARSLIAHGYRVSMFKVGPDYIDPSYHAAVTGEPSRNLDKILMGNKVVERFCRYSSGSDMAIIEGVAGLYDSPDGESEEGSTAQMAKLLKAPVVIVINGERINRTAGALIKGLRDFDSKVKIAGVILTNVVGSQEQKIRKAVESEGVEVIGTIKRDRTLEKIMAYRHLGLVHANETGRDAITLASSLASQNIDAERVLKLAKERSDPLGFQATEREKPSMKKLKIAIALGRAFSFYYPETIEFASEVGDVKFVDPEKDAYVDADMLIIGGGFPEVYAEQLEKNKPFMKSVKDHVEKGKLFYGECGGLIYLADAIAYMGSEYRMSGVIDAYAVVMNEPVGHGYVTGEVIKDNIIASKGTILKGHEFHYTKMIMKNREIFSLKYLKGNGIEGFDGVYIKNAYASFMHIHPETYNFLNKMLLQKFM
jgi:cobyrinic acid a,c-diamide synthase